MADDARRWSVTYTKHIKQKRKVYQDGFLEIQSSSHKVKLYDDCDKLLESKIVKLEDDAVRSGETLTFGAYLVDIGDPHGESKPIPNPILHRDKTMADRNGTPISKTSKGSLHVRKASSINLSPSQKIIREFKRREVNKYCSSPVQLDTVKDDSTEWQVLYTTQLTQKAKKFHDGILKVTVSGLRGRQAMLYDETRRHLDSRFLKNEEVISAGESLRFDGHIVDIVEQRDNEPLKDTNVDRSNCYTRNTVQSKCHNEHPAEWDVMYTTQVTQKAKKFHDGILKLASSGSQGRQVATLLAEDGTVLSHRYLKQLEEINSGSSFNMQNYLVEIGEPRKVSEGECTKKASTAENEILEIKRFDVNKISATRPLSDVKPPKRVSSMQDTDTKVKNYFVDKVISTSISKSKPLRDANSILCILRKPTTQEGVSVEEVLPSEASETCCEKIPVDAGGHLEVMPSNATSNSKSNEAAEETKHQSNTKISKDYTTIDSSGHDVSIDRENGFESMNSINAEFPSFDLGFD